MSITLITVPLKCSNWWLFFLYFYLLYGHLPPTKKTIKVRQTRHSGHCWRSKDELISDVLQWTRSYGRTKAGRSARTNIQQLCENMGCSPEEQPEAMNDREWWQEMVRDIRAGGMTWWWWWWKWYYSLYRITFVKICHSTLFFLWFWCAYLLHKFQNFLLACLCIILSLFFFRDCIPPKNDLLLTV